MRGKWNIRGTPGKFKEIPSEFQEFAKAKLTQFKVDGLLVTFAVFCFTCMLAGWNGDLNEGKALPVLSRVAGYQLVAGVFGVVFTLAAT